MYRDEVQALRARVATLETELEAARALRRAAEARRRAAQARVAGVDPGHAVGQRRWLGALLVVALLGLSLYGGWRIGHQHRFEGEQEAGPASVAASRDCDPSALLIHAHPEGASLLVDGALLTDSAPADGMLVPVAPRTAVEVVAMHDGYLPKRLLVETSDCGVRHVFVTARRQHRAGGGR